MKKISKLEKFLFPCLAKLDDVMSDPKAKSRIKKTINHNRDKLKEAAYGVTTKSVRVP